VVGTPVPYGLAPGGLPPSAAGRILVAQLPAESATGAVPANAHDLPEGSRIVLFDPAVGADGVIDLTEGFSAAGRPDLSRDGKRVLFVARRSSTEPLAVWERSLDQGATRRVVGQPSDCTRAIYAATLYTLDAAAPSEQIVFSVAAAADAPSSAGPSVLHASRLDGSRVRRITYNFHGATDPLLLTDGRLLYASGRPPEAGGGTAWFTVHTDGTDVFVFADAHASPAIRGMACETDGGEVVYVESTAPDRRGGGRLVAVDRTRSLHSRRVIAEAGAGSYHSPSALAGGGLLVSHRGADEATYGVHVFDPGSGTRIRRVFDSPAWDDVHAIAVRPRPVRAGRSSVVDESVDFGFLYCLDTHRTDRSPPGPPGEGGVERLRVIRAPRERAGDRGDDTVIDEVPVHADGSFYLQIPARTPIRLETLGADGAVRQAMQHSIWVMPGERRGCIGCHADRELSPPNRHVLALREAPTRIGIAGDPPEGPEPSRPAPPDGAR